MQNDNRAAGPGAVDNSQIDPGALLDGASDYEYVEVLNPLSVDFIGKFGVEKPVNVPMKFQAAQGTTALTTDEAGLATNYGLGGFKNSDHPTLAKITNTVTIKAGQTLRMRGGEAQVVVRQLVNEIIQREGNKLFIADPTTRNNVEKRIVLKRGSINELMGSSPVSVMEQVNTAIKDSNETEFPEVREGAPIPQEANPVGPSVPEQSEHRKPGRPPKAQPTAA